jgi:hypothetical protein
MFCLPLLPHLPVQLWPTTIPISQSTYALAVHNAGTLSPVLNAANFASEL